MNHDTETHTAPAAPADDTELLATSVVKTPDLAWSAADDTPTVAAYQPRRGRWLIAVAAMLVGLAAAAGTSLYYTQQHQPRNPTTHPAPTVVPPPKPAPPAPPMDPDSRFVSHLEAKGMKFKYGQDQIAAAGRTVCIDLSQGYTMQDITNEIANTGQSIENASVIAVTAVENYCPQRLEH
jgi:hypothetical protein